MANVPRVSTPSVGPAPAGLSPQTIHTDADMFGAGVGRAMQGVGNELGQLGDVFSKHALLWQAQSEGILSNDAILKATLELGVTQADYNVRTGMDAFEANESYNNKLQEIQKKYGAGLPPGAFKTYNDAIAPRVVNGIVSGSSHAAQERRGYQDGQSKAIVTNSINAGAQNPNDDNLFKINQDQIASQITNYEKSIGTSDELIKAKVFAAQSEGIGLRVKSLALSNPDAARKVLEVNRSKMTAPELLEAEKAVTASEGTLGVNQVVNEVKNGGTGIPSNTFLHSRAVGRAAAEPYAIDKLHPAFQDRLTAYIQTGFPPEVAAKMGIYSGARTNEDQTRIQGGNPRPQVATPGGSEHQFDTPKAETFGGYGRAADISYNGLPLDQAPPEIQKMAHDAAAKFGLTYPILHIAGESHHIEMVEARGGKFEAGASGNSSLKSAYGGIYQEVTTKSGLPQGLLWAQGQVENGAQDPYAISSAGAVGLAQITPDTAKTYGIPLADLNDPRKSVEAQALIMQDLLKKGNGDIDWALVAYNAGPGVADKWARGGRSPSLLSAETQGYLQKFHANFDNMTLTNDPRKIDVKDGAERVRLGVRARYPGHPDWEEAAVKNYLGDVTTVRAIDNDKRVQNYNTVEAAAIPVWNPATNSYAAPTDPSQLPPAMLKQYMALDPADQKKIQGQLSSNAESMSKGKAAPTPTQINRMSEIKGMQVRDPSGFRTLDIGAELQAGRITLEQAKDLSTDKSKPLNELSNSNLHIPEHLSDNQGALIAAGIPVHPAANDPEGAAKLDRLTGALIRDFNDHLARSKGVMPTSEEVRGMLAKELTKVVTPSRGTFGDWVSPWLFGSSKNMGMAFEVEVPPEESQALIDAYAKANLPRPSDAFIRDAYIRKLQGAAK